MRGRHAHNIIMIRQFAIILICISTLATSACSTLGMATGAAAVTGISAAQEGGLSRAYTDTKIKVLINEAWFNFDVEAFRKLSTTINHGRVLVTGVVQDPAQRVEAIRLVWQVPGVTQVMNEIRVAESSGVTGFVKDAWITSRLRGSLTLDREVQSINYSIDTVQGIVYLMGVAQNQAELNQVIETARTISGVKQVVSYVKLAGEPLQNDKVLDENLPAEVENSNAPQQLHNNTGTNTNLSTRTYDSNPYQNEQAVELDVPTRTLPANQPSIEDQYYN